MCTVRIGSDTGDHLTIIVKGRTYPNATCAEDEDWLTTDINISVGAFRGQVNAVLRSSEIEFFVKELETLSRTLKGTAEYTSVEDWAAIRITGDGLGHLVARGFLADDLSNGNRLNFNIDFDQTSLARVLNGLQNLLTKYPPS